MAAGDLGAEIRVPRGTGRTCRRLSDVREQIRLRIDELEAEQRTCDRCSMDSKTRSSCSTGRCEIRQSCGERALPCACRWLAGTRRSRFRLPVSSRHGSSTRSARRSPSRRTCRPTRPAEACAWPSCRSAPPKTRPDSGRSLGHHRARAARAHAQGLVANASHELKTPVAGIQLLAESRRPGLRRRRGAGVLFAQQIAEESTRLQRLVRDLLDLSRLETAPPADSIINVREGLPTPSSVISRRRPREVST